MRRGAEGGGGGEREKKKPGRLPNGPRSSDNPTRPHPTLNSSQWRQFDWDAALPRPHLVRATQTMAPEKEKEKEKKKIESFSILLAP